MPLNKILLVGIMVCLNAGLAQSDAYKDSLEIVRASPVVQSALGSDITVQSEPVGLGLDDPNSEFEEWSVKLTGSLGTGDLYGVANQFKGSWEFSQIVLVLNGGKKRLNLAPLPRRLNLPPVPAQKVYLVPVGLSKTESLDWAPAYYRAKLGVDVAVLPPIALDSKLLDPTRKQLNATLCSDFLLKLNPELAGDPSTILIAVTSRDMYIPEYTENFHWKYAENLRVGDRFALISSARLHPPSVDDHQNPEWSNSRLQKMLTKNLVMLYFNLPMSSDYTSLLSGGLLSGKEIDQMSGQIIGLEGRWTPFVNEGGPGVTIYDTPGKAMFWKMILNGAVPNVRTQVFTADLSVGLFTQRKTDFLLDEEYPFQFTRAYTSGDEFPRSFGRGAMHSLDMFLVGQMGYYIEVCLEDGSKAHFDRQQPLAGQPESQIYRETKGEGGPFAHAEAEYSGGVWKLKRTDGWTFFFPYHGQWLPQYVTVLNSFSDPAGHKYEMERDNVGALLSLRTPSGKWLHFENDAQHRIRKITSSQGRTLQYEYDQGGRLAGVKDSDGNNDSYSYDEKSEMLAAVHGKDAPMLRNEYFIDGYIKKQTMADGHAFEYWYRHGPRNVIEQNLITDPNGLRTYIQYVPEGYMQSLPSSPPR